MLKIKQFFWMFSLFCVLGGQTVQAKLDAQLDRSTIQDSETVNLTITTDQQIQGVTPDLSLLQQDFDILDQGQSTSLQIINGQQTASTTWTISLAPKRLGKLTIPPLHVGNEQTPSRELQVLAAQQQVDKDGNAVAADVLLEVSVEPKTSYVQSQFTYVIKLYHAVSLRAGSITQPQPENALVQKLGNDASYETQRQGRHYRVIEQRYGLFPEQSGKLDIPPVVFQGTVIDPNQRSRSRLSPLFDDMFDVGGTKPVRLRSEAVSVEIKPRPNEFLGNHWLPATDLSLKESWSEDPPKFKVGEPITRILTLQARGLLAEQLPDIDQSLPPTLKVYPDQAKQESSLDGTSVIGQRQQNLALIPTQAGTVTLPAIEVAWWDTQQEKTRYARLPEHKIEVLPAAQTATPATTPVPLPELPPLPVQTPQPTAAPQVITVTSAGFWPWLCAVLGLGWLTTFLLLWLKPRNIAQTNAPAAEDKTTPKRRAALQALEQACKNHQASLARQALLDWATASFPNQRFNHLGAVANRLSDTGAKDALADLDRHLYARAEQKHANWHGEVFWQKIQPSLHKPAKSTSSGTSLAALYPVPSTS